ncbi:MAG: zinc ABC transporter substrate-binding protein [Pirellulaceae bacterium]|jgi:manganese/zinc/iron transport system substrate-binding protein|nr:zinc ABC transporter substrate-binding protein [Pirellulaceae bacterium]
MRRGLWIALVTVLGVVGCEGSPATGTSRNKTSTGPITAVATTGMVADLVKNIGGEHVQVTALMGPGVDPHLYKSSPADISQLNRANVIFYSGLHLEGKLAELLERMSAKKPTIAVAEAISPDKLLTDESGAHDPHVWFDVSLWSEAAGAVRDALAKFDPEHASEYRAACEAYQTRLAELDGAARSELAAVPKDQRVLVTAHDAFRYFGRAYDVEVRGIQGISTDSEAGVRDVTQLVGFLVERKIPAVFVETSVADQNIKSLLEGCAARGHTVKIGGTLFSDAMGEDGTLEGTYEGMVRHNVQTIVEALR